MPALSIVPAPERRSTDKIIRLAEHRPVADNDKGLSTGERMAFQQIGERLKKDAGKSARDAEDSVPPSAVAEPQDPAEASDSESAVAGDSQETEDLRRIDGAEDAPREGRPAEAQGVKETEKDDAEPEPAVSSAPPEDEAHLAPPAPETGAAKAFAARHVAARFRAVGQGRRCRGPLAA